MFIGAFLSTTKRNLKILKRYTRKYIFLRYECEEKIAIGKQRFMCLREKQLPFNRK